MKALHIGAASALLLALAGCNTSAPLVDKKVDYRTAAIQVPTLEVPPDLTIPSTDERYKLPSESGNSTTYSDYSKIGGAVTQARVTSSILPEIKGVHLEKNGSQRWLVVEDKPENVWPIVKSFWMETGLPVKTEDQTAGIMETDWVENRAKIPQGGIRNVIGKVFDNLYSSGERDLYRTRLERGKDGNSTEIYITHKGMQEMPADAKNGPAWQPRPNDPELEAAMLQRLLARFGGAPVQNLVNTNKPANKSPVAANLQNIPSGDKSIVINDNFDNTWRKTGMAIQSAGYLIEDKDRAKGIYYVRVTDSDNWKEKLQFWKSESSSELRYRIKVKDNGNSCTITATDQRGMVDETAEKVIAVLHKNMN